MAVNELRRWPRQLPRGGLHDAAVVLLLLRILGQVVPSHGGLCCFRLVRWVWRACLTNKQPDHGEICLVCLSICVCVRVYVSSVKTLRTEGGQGPDEGRLEWERHLGGDETGPGVRRNTTQRSERETWTQAAGAIVREFEGSEAPAERGRAGAGDEWEGERWGVSDDDRRTAPDEGGGDRLLRPASNRGGTSQRQKTHAKGLLSVVTGGSLYWSGPTQSYLAGHLNCPALQVAGLSRSTNYTHTAHIYQRRSNGRKLIEVCQQAVPRIGLIVLNPTWRPPQQPTWNLRIRNSAIYQMCSRPREWQWPSEGSSSPIALLHAFCELLTTVGAKNKGPKKFLLVKDKLILLSHHWTQRREGVVA